MSVNTSSKSLMMIELKKSKDFGTELLKAFHGASNLKISFSQLVVMLESRPNQKNFLTILGGAVINSGSSQSDAISAMRSMGKKSGTRVPASNAYFMQAIVDKATEFSYVDAAIYTASETAKTVVHGVESVGNTLITTGKILNFIFPAVVLLALYFMFKKKFVN